MSGRLSVAEMNASNTLKNLLLILKTQPQGFFCACVRKLTHLLFQAQVQNRHLQISASRTDIHQHNIQ